MSIRTRVQLIALSVLFVSMAVPLGSLCQERPEGRTISINGIEMYYETVGEGEPLVLLHGFMQSGHSYDPVVEEFSGRYRLIIPDLRGHGGSTNPSGEFTMRQSALDIFALLDHLEIDRFKGVGISAGAVTLLHMATRQPDRVEALVLIGSGVYYPEACRGILGKMDANTYPEPGWNNLRKIHRHGDDQIRSLFAQLAGFADSYDDVTFTPPHLSRIEARTLLVHGDRDYCFPVSMIADVYSSIPNAYLWIVPNGGHVPVFGRWTSSFAETALEFLGGSWEKK